LKFKSTLKTLIITRITLKRLWSLLHQKPVVFITSLILVNFRQTITDSFFRVFVIPRNGKVASLQGLPLT